MIRDERAMAACRRSAQVYHEQFTEQTALSAGVAFTCPAYPNLHEGNHFREVVIPESGSLASVFDEVHDFYTRLGLICYAWVPAAGTPIEPLEAFLSQRGFTTRENLCMVWNREVDFPAVPDVRILPARPMRKALRELQMNDTTYDEATRRMLVASHNDRLDDPQYDQVVAMIGNEPAGTAVLLQAGEIGRIENVFVAEQFRRRSVGLALMAHLLAMAKRLALRITVLETTPDNAAAIALYQRCGFDPAGTFIEFRAPEATRELEAMGVQV